MAVRLHMKLGVVAEHDRLADSPDTLVVVEPSVGSVARSKGHLYLLVTSRISSRHALEATRLAAETIRNEYYYDESAGTTDLGTPLRLKAPTGGYDGRSQVRVAVAADVESAMDLVRGPQGMPLLAERELDFEAELSVIVVRGMDGKPAIFPPSLNLHDAGILVESVAPADLPAAALREAVAIALNLAAAMDLVGTLTVELFLLRDGSLVVNELAPRVHNSGHWTIEGAATSQFEQHVRAICGLPLGETNTCGPTAIVNVLGTGPEREARLLGVDDALGVPGTHLHLYDKRRVFERRKMGHVTALGANQQEALDRARAARSRLRWADGS